MQLLTRNRKASKHIWQTVKARSCVPVSFMSLPLLSVVFHVFLRKRKAHEWMRRRTKPRVKEALTLLSSLRASGYLKAMLMVCFIRFCVNSLVFCGFCPWALRLSVPALKSESKTKHVSLFSLSLTQSGSSAYRKWFHTWLVKPRVGGARNWYGCVVSVSRCMRECFRFSSLVSVYGNMDSLRYTR